MGKSEPHAKLNGLMNGSCGMLIGLGGEIGVHKMKPR